MADLSVRCPGCEARLRVQASKPAVRCPKCGTTVRLHDPAEKADDPDVKRLLSKVKIIERVEDEPSSRPPKRRRADDAEDEDDRPRSRRRDDDEEEEDRPRRRRLRDDDEDDSPRRRPSQPQGDGPWLLAAGAAGLCFFLTLGLAFLLFGTVGLPPGKDGPGGKLIGLGVGLIAALIVIPVGVIGVKNRKAMGKWGIEIEGNMGVATGFVQSIIGGLIGGFALYGLLFTLLNGR